MGSNDPHRNDPYTSDPYNRIGLLSFLFSMAFVFSFFVYVVVIHPGVDLKEDLQFPTAKVDQPLAKVDVSGVTEPWVPNPDMVAHGRNLYMQNCAMCHGAEGRGDGAAGQGLNPPTRNLVTGPWKLGGGYIGFYRVLTEGLAGGSMASYSWMSKIDRWALTQFVESITEAKVKEDPAKVAEFAQSAK
jgi:mono/diheme cytochrome c family protein